MAYLIEKGRVVHYDEPRYPGQAAVVLKPADPSTFVILNNVWAKDEKYVWCRGALVRTAYAPAFKALNAAFGRDNECVFDSSWGRVVKGVNAAAFEVLDDGVMGCSRTITLEASYARCEGKIYHYQSGDHKTMWLRGADASTFRALKWTYGCDARKVYCRNRPLSGARPDSFRQITPHFSSDGRKVYYYAQQLVEADPATFEVFGAEYWANHSNPTVEELRARKLSDFWARDKDHVFYQHLVMEGLDPTTAQVVGDMLKDATQVYVGFQRPIEGADATSFERVPGWYSYYRDRRRVYHLWEPIEGVDLATFESLPFNHPSKGQAWDANWIYDKGNRWKPRSEFTD
jgi:hypothetical protein